MGAAVSDSGQYKKGSRDRLLANFVWLSLAFASGLLVFLTTEVALSILQYAQADLDADEAVSQGLAGVVGNLPVIGNALSALAGNLGLAAWLKPNLGTSAFVIGFTSGLLAFGVRSEKVSRHLFATLDTTVALPIAQPTTALEPLRPALLDGFETSPMAWIEPTDGPRKDIWQALEEFAFGPGKKFEYQLLLGGPGAGKTRMAIEFARRLLAKQGDDDQGHLILHGPFNQDRLLTRSERLKSWWRIRVLARDPQPKDIWHIGWFSPEALSKTGNRVRVKGQLQADLEDWRPISPTFILLDDPLHDDSAFVVETLNKNARLFRHRVRILIVNQTVPGDLHFSRLGRDGIWRSEVQDPFMAPLVLSANAPLSNGEIRRLAGNLPLSAVQPILGDRGLSEFRVITRGNPLLVELGLAWLVAGKPLSLMTEDALLEDRSRRFLQAIRTAGFEAGQGQLVDLLTMATIANGAPTTLPGGKEDETIWSVFGVQRIDRERGARLFPTEVDIDLRTYIPPMRPETMATAFARAAMMDLSPTDRNRIVRTAWRANPRGTLRTLLRIDGGYRLRTDQEDPLAATFKAVPMEIGLPPLEVFRLLAHASCSASPADWDDGQYHLGRGLLDAALQSGRELSAEHLLTAFGILIDLILEDRSQRILRETNAARVLMELICAIDRAGIVFHPQFLSDLGRWAVSPRAVVHECMNDWLFGKHDYTALSPTEGTTAILSDLLMKAGSRKTRMLLLRLIDHAASKEMKVLNQEVLRTCMDFVARAEMARENKSPSAWQELFMEFAPLFETARDHPYLGLVVATAMIGAAALDTDNVSNSKFFPSSETSSDEDSITRRIDAIGLSFPDHEGIQQERAKAWRYVTYATRSDLALCRLMVDRVEAIGLRFPDHEGIQLERAAAWCYVSYAVTSDPALCRQIADRVEAIGLRFPDHEGIQQTRAAAWGHVTYATRSDPALCCQMADRVEAIGLRFPDHEGIQQTRAEAWGHVTYATRSDPTLCRQMADRIEAIGLRFPDHEGIQLERAAAWCYASYAVTLDSALCRQIADRVEAIGLRFPDHEGIQLERAAAWGHVTYATRSDPALCCQMADRVEAIGLRFPDHEGIQQTRAEAWGHVTYATRSDPTLCRQMADRIEAIGLRFPDHEGIQLERAAAWGYVTYATRSDPALCCQIADRVEAIGLRLPDHEGIQEEVTKAKAFWQTPELSS